MPELPEVETVCQAIRQSVEHQCITDVSVRHHRLRWPIPDLNKHLSKQRINAISRRGKYILIQLGNGHLIIHLGMSGHIRLLTQPQAANKHDHVDIQFDNNITLRYNDPRRFGAILWTSNPIDQHPLLAALGPEPLSRQFSGKYLFQNLHTRKVAIKSALMNSHIVVGIGNIYANEALFHAGIHPAKPAKQLNLTQCQQLCRCSKIILRRAIKAGGTTLNDFYHSDGKPGYFSQQLSVYGKSGQPCPQCQQALTGINLNQRSTVFCASCQH